MSIIKTDRIPELKTDRIPELKTETSTTVVDTPKEETKTPMTVEEGGNGTISQKQMVTILIVIVVIAVVVVLSVYFYKKFQKSPLTTPA